MIRRRYAQNGVFDPALRPYARRLYALTLALLAIRVCWLPKGVAAAAAAAEAATVETLVRRLADAETLNPEERQRLSRQMATLRQQIAHPLVDPSWDPARAGMPPGTAGRNTP